MKLSFVIFLILFAIAVTVEAIYGYRHQRNLYDWKDSILNVTLGIIGVSFRFALKTIWLAFWLFLSQFALLDIPETVLTWVVLFFSNEFVYYWFHRWSHENRFLWAVHVNHHSSQKLNFSTTARLPFFNFVLHSTFWIPLVLIGFDPFMVFAVSNVGFLFALYQHTQIIGKINWMEYIFNTPNHHRIHHASNPEYINGNYGSCLIIFDRLFGSFKEELEGVDLKYGITNNIQTYNPIKVIFHEWIDIAKGR